MTSTRYNGLGRLAVLGMLSSICSQASAFSFSYSSPVQCGNLTVSWTGGTAPFSLLVSPFYSTPQNISIPASAFNGTHGSYTTTLRVTGKSNQGRFLLTMSDATGVGTGGTSGILTASTATNSCNTTDPGTDFYYSLDSSLQQCRPYIWSHYETAVQPITITGLIPLGKTFVLNAPLGDSFSWTTNIASGTNIVFIVTDAQGRQGGSSDLYTVAATDDTSCITNDSPGSTAQSATATSTATAVPSTSPANQGSNAAVIGSSIAGGAVFLVALASLVWFFIFKNRKQHNDGEDDSMRGINAGKRRGRSLDLLPDDQSTRSAVGAAVRYPLPSPHTGDALDPERGRSVYEPDPYVLPPPPPESHSYFSRSSHHEDELSELGLGDPFHRRIMSTSTSASGLSKAQMAAAASASGSARALGPQRFILHTDAGEIEDDEVVELPPMYTQVQPRRTPSESTASGAPSGSTAVDDPLRTG